MRQGRAQSAPQRRNRARQNQRVEETLLAIQEEYITLGQLLKSSGAVGSGGEVKYFLAETAVLVNKEPEQRRGRKLRAGDLIVIPGSVSIRLVAAATDSAGALSPDAGDEDVPDNTGSAA